MKRWCVLTTVLLLGVGNVWSQMTVNGRVLNAASGRPIEGANIRVEHSLSGCMTNAKGEFLIRHLPDGEHLLSVTHVSYLPQTYTVKKGEAEVVIKLEESPINIGQVVVTGTGTHHRMTDSPVPVSVITAKDIRESNLSTMEEVLTKMNPAFSFVTSGMGTTMSLNGLDDSYILVLENGKRLAGDDRIDRIQVANIKRIEILYGAASALYGSDAIGGVVHIITDDAKNTLRVSNDIRYGSKGRLSEAVHADFNAGKFGSYTSYQRQQADSWQLSPLEATKKTDKKTGITALTGTKPTTKVASTAFYSNTVGQRFTYALTDRLSLHLRGNYYDWKNDRLPENYDYNMNHETYTYGAGAKYMVHKSAYVDVDFYSDNFTSRYDYIKEKGDFKLHDKEVRKRIRYYNASVKGIFKLGKYQKLSAGTEYVKEHLRSASDKLDGENMYTLAFFVQDEIDITKSLQAVVGIRYIYNEYFKNYATPTISVRYKLSDFNFRASYASGFRTPTLSQLYATDVAKTHDVLTIGNLQLKPEKSDYFMVNAEYTHSRFTLSASAYINKVRDRIDYRVLGEEVAAAMGHDEVQQRDNIAKAEIKGVSLSAHAYIGAGFSLGGAYHFTDTEDKTTRMPIDKSVKNAWTANAQWGHRWGLYKLNVNINGRIQEGRYSKTYYYDPAPNFSLWDLNTHHSFQLKSFVLEPGVGIENLFDYRDDRPWNSNYTTLNPGRSFYVSLSVRWKQ